MNDRNSFSFHARKAAILAVVAILGLSAMALLGGCSSYTPKPAAQNSSAPGGSAPMKQASTVSSSMATTGSGMKCAQCTGAKRAPTPTAGQATVQSGVQVVTISLKDGGYVPDVFTVQAGMPVRVSFEGTATGCLGHPTFKSLNKTADVTRSSASLDLGVLKPGTYKFTCAMGMNAGTLTVQ